MTGPEHYAAGEASLEDAAKWAPTTQQRLALIAEAQAYFMAAQVAATMDAGFGDVQRWGPWDEVTS